MLLPQYETERIQRQYLFGYGGRIHHAVALRGLTQADDGVGARVAPDGRGDQTIECRYVVGCDGARSVVRAGLGLEYARGAEMADVLQVRCGSEIAPFGVVGPGGEAVDYERFALLTDAAGDFKAAYDAAVSCVYLVRSDGYVGYRSDRVDAERLETYLQRVFGES